MTPEQPTLTMAEPNANDNGGTLITPAQQQALMQKSLAAAQKQDYNTMQALGKQSDALNAQITQTQLDMNAGQKTALDAVQRDRTAKVRIAMNNPRIAP